MPLKQSIKAMIPTPVRRAVKQSFKQADRRMHRIAARLQRPNVYRGSTSERVGVIFDAPTEMSIAERMFLYSLVRGSRPRRILEIGTSLGGSAAIMAAALEDIGGSPGRIVGVDPAPNVAVPSWRFFGRFDLVVQPSPEGVAEAHRRAGGPFDFVLIDGLHIYDQVKKDLAATIPLLAERAYVLFHDAFHHGVSEAIREGVQSEPKLHDCGYVCSNPSTDVPVLAYGGFRMLRYSASATADPQPLIRDAFAAAGRAEPEAHPDLRNHDLWYCRAIKPCPRCQQQQAQQAHQNGQAVPQPPARNGDRHDAVPATSAAATGGE